jgi:hypothetical protein
VEKRGERAQLVAHARDERFAQFSVLVGPDSSNDGERELFDYFSVVYENGFRERNRSTNGIEKY